MNRTAEVEAVGGELIAYDPAIFPDLINQDPREVAARFAKRFMAAETIDDLFNVLDGNTSQSLVGRRVQIRAVAWAPYQSDAGIIPLAVCDAADVETGEALEFATTSQALTMFVRRAELIGALPFNARITETKTRSGQTALNFERV